MGFVAIYGVGGGGTFTLIEKSITANGVYNASSDNADGFSKVTVNVPAAQPTLFTPSLSINYQTSVMTITDNNGNFASYEVYAKTTGDYTLVTTATNRTIDLASLFPTYNQNIYIKVKAVGTDFVSSAFTNEIVWEYGTGTANLAYTLNSDNQSYSCSGIGTATETDIEIGSIHDGLPVTSVSASAFNGQSQLTSVTIPASVTSFGNNAFNGCSGLTAVYFNGTVSDWCSIAIGDWQQTATPLYYAHNLYINGQLLTDLVIPDTLTEIGTLAFQGCTSIKTVTFPQNGVLTKIGAMAFTLPNDGNGLVTINKIPNTVTNLTYWTFYGQEKLRGVNFGDGIQRIDGTCNGCYEISEVHLGSSVNYIEDYSFTAAGSRAQNHASKAIYTSKALNPPRIGGGSLPVWNIPFNAYCPYAINPTTGNRSIEDYKVASNWVSWTNKMNPLVNTVADLSSIDTTSYTKACVVGNEEYTEYEYTNGQWGIVQ